MIALLNRAALDALRERAKHVRASSAIAAALTLFAFSISPASVASVRLILTVNGVTVSDETRPGSTSFAINPSGDNFAAHLAGRAFQDGDTAAKASVSGTTTAIGRATSTSQATYRLVAPAGADFASGKLVIYTVLSGEILGNATIDLDVNVLAFTIQWEASASDKRTIANQPGNEQIEFDIVVSLPATLDPTRRIDVDTRMVLNAIANIIPVNAQQQASSAENTGKVTGFRVLNAAGVQVPGFTLSAGSKVIPERTPPPGGQALAIEYYNASFEHYFITAIADEIGKLDSGVIPGWERTGESFNVYTVAGSGRVAVCRFFTTSFGAKSSHFYAPRGLGCEATLQNPVWLFEGDVFFTLLPDSNGVCPAGNLPVYRLYNDGQGGAPNHRFTTIEATRLDMIRDGYIAEGSGIGVGMCSPQ